MLGVLDQRPFRLGIVAPEQEHHRFFPLVQQPDHIIGELFPAFAFVGIRLSGTDGQHRVQQQYPCFAQLVSSPCLPVLSMPTSSLISLKMFTRDGGGATPFRTEKLSPCAWFGP